jgi:hypothetical protein
MFSGSGKMDLVKQMRSPRSPRVYSPSSCHSRSNSPSSLSRRESPFGSPRIGSPSIFTNPRIENIAERAASPPRTIGNSNYNSTNTVISSANNITKLLNSSDIDGVVVNRMLESTIRMRPEKDSIHLKFFKSKDIDFLSFKSKLFDLFKLVFSDEEFRYVTSLFDEYNAGKIDGYLFLIFYTKLSTLRKDRESLKLREKEDLKMKQITVDAERKKLETEKKSIISADYDFSEETRDTALRYVYMYIYVCIYVHMHVCISIHLYVYTYM